MQLEARWQVWSIEQELNMLEFISVVFNRQKYIIINPLSYAIGEQIDISSSSQQQQRPASLQFNQSTLNLSQNNIIFIPKNLQTVSGCMCNTIITHTNNYNSSMTTARTVQSDIPTQIVKIQSSRQLKPKIVKPNHRRTQTKLINLIAGNYTEKEDKDKSCVLESKSHDKNWSKQIQGRKKMSQQMGNHRLKFLSDELYVQQSSQQSENWDKMQNGRVFRQKQKLSRCSLTSRLWRYRGGKSRNVHTIPCLYYQGSDNHSKIIIYFHGNGEDISGCHNFLRNLSAYVRISVLAVEYPGYSVYRGCASSQEIERDAREVVQFLNGQIGFEFRDMLVMGRSIGTGPAVHVASLFEVGGLVLLSPFLSLCEVVLDLYGVVASSVLKERFNNRQRAKQVNCCCLIVHGTQDKLISVRHAMELSRQFRGYCLTKIVKNMSHSLFSHEEFYSLVEGFIRSVGFTD